MPKGLIVNPANRDDGVAKIQQRAGELLGKVVAAQARIPELIFWGRSILSDQEQKDWKDRLGSLKGFLESLQPFNTSGKLKNFPHDSAAVLGQKPAIDLSREVDELGTVLQQTNPLTSYLGKAEALLDARHSWQDVVRTGSRPSHGQDRKPDAALGSRFQAASDTDAGAIRRPSTNTPIWPRTNAPALARTTTSAGRISPRIHASRKFRRSPTSK